MYNIAIVGDTHIDTKISSRKDDYFNTCLVKLEEIANNCTNIIILGDFFNKTTIPNNYFVELYTHLDFLKRKNGNRFFTIIGNHDVIGENESWLSKTALGLCDITNLVSVITPDKPVTIEGICFHTTYVNVEKARKHLNNCVFTDSDILLLHHYFEDQYVGLNRYDIKNTGIKKVFLGHEHTPIEQFVKNVDNIELYRCGSLLRTAADSDSLKRSIYYFTLNKDKEVTVHKLNNVKPACDVFIEQALTRTNLNRQKFVNNVNEVLEKYATNVNAVDNKFSIQAILQELQASQECISYIQSKYEQINEVFR